MKRNDVIEVAKNEVGYFEKATNQNLDSKTENSGYGNYTKYMRDTFPELQGLAWCCAFIDWCFMKAYTKEKANSLLTTWTAKCSILYDSLKIKKRIVDNAKKGEIVFYKNASGIINHIGLVIEVKDRHIKTIEGNTSGGTNSVISNGDGVKEKSYKINNPKIVGYSKLKYDDEDVEEEISEDDDDVITLIATNVNIRSGPSTSYRVIGRTTKGDKHKVLDKKYDNFDNLWIKINTEPNGFIRSDFTNF